MGLNNLMRLSEDNFILSGLLFELLLETDFLNFIVKVVISRIEVLQVFLFQVLEQIFY